MANDKIFEDWLGDISGEREIAVLRHQRNHEGGAEKSLSGDWDLAVRDAPLVGHLLAAKFGKPDLRISRQYVEQWFYEWNQVDLLPVFEWNGIEYLDPDRFWVGVSKDESGLPRPRLAHDAFIAWMTGVLWGGKFNERYASMIFFAWADDKEEFKFCLRSAFGRGWSLEIESWLEDGILEESAKNAQGLRLSLLWQSLRRFPGESIWRQLCHWRVELNHHWNPPFPWIAFLGPDGSGKSTVIERVTEGLAKRRLKVKMIHWSPRILRPGIDLEGGIVSDPHGSQPRSYLVSLLKPLFLIVEWFVAWPWFLRHPRAKDRFLFSDRYYSDLLIDPQRYRYGASRAWARFWFRFLPKPDRVIVLTGDPEVIHARKREVPLEELKRQIGDYTRFAGDCGANAVEIDASRPLEEVVARAMANVLGECREGFTYSERSRSATKEILEGYEADSFKEDNKEAVVKGSVGTDSSEANELGRLRVLFSAYACSPNRGAEANVSWNLAREISRRHELWVVTRSNNRHEIETSTESWKERIHWVYLDPPQALTFWRTDKWGVHPFYLWWQILAKSRVKKLMKNHRFDLFHHVTFGSFLLPSFISDLGVPMVFGPVGGGEKTPEGIEMNYSLSGRLEELRRELEHWAVRKVKVMHHWYTSAAWTLAATPMTLTALEELGVKNLSLLPQSGIGGDRLEKYANVHGFHIARSDGALRLVVASRLVHWKGVELALEGVALASKRGVQMRLTILQEGPDRSRLRNLAAALGIKHIVSFEGRLDTLEEVYEKMKESDVLLHPALHEAFGQACLEALALGVPVICLDWGGPGLIITERCGFKIKPTSRADVISKIAEAIEERDRRRVKGEDMSKRCRERAKEFRWSKIAQQIDAIYKIITDDGKRS